MTEPTSNEAKRRQIARELRGEIDAGRLRPGDKLPSSRALAGKYGTSAGTVNQAMDELGIEGYIVSRPRSGRVVADTAGPAGAAARRGRPRAVYIGGHTGSGKSLVGRALAQQARWALLDRDTITRAVVDTALVALGSTIADRESQTYLDLERAEYQCLDMTIQTNIAEGVSVIAVAPYLQEFENRMWFERQSAALNSLGADMSVIWVCSSAESMRTHLERRAAARDTWKLANWDQYLESIDVDFTPSWPHTVIRNGLDDEPIQAQVKNFLLTCGLRG